MPKKKTVLTDNERAKRSRTLYIPEGMVLRIVACEVPENVELVEVGNELDARTLDRGSEPQARPSPRKKSVRGPETRRAKRR